MPSPFDAAVSCPTPEHLAAQYCIHATHAELQQHLAEIEAACQDEDELFEGLSEQSLARLEVWETDNGMWAVDGLVSADTGALFAKLLTTAVAPPRQDECQADQEDQAVPPTANRNAEALHQMLASFGADPKAPTRHGHTATLHLTCDLDTLRGEDTGRLPQLEGRPISVAKARLLACESQAIPSIFNYTTGEAIELGRTARLPNAALRRKLELEQPGGCAWHGCSRPIQWTEAHHLRHWADGGATTADNLILLCRFHHGRIHTPGWTITKTGPGQALIVHHHDHEQAPNDMTEHEGPHRCGCPDWRTDTDLDTEFASDITNVFPLGLFPEEHAPKLKEELDRAAEQAETDAAWAAAKAAKAKARARFTTEATATTDRNTGTRATTPVPEPEPDSHTGPAWATTDPGPPPYLPRPPRQTPAAGASTHDAPARTQQGVGPLAMPGPGRPPRTSTLLAPSPPDRTPTPTDPIAEHQAQVATYLAIAARLNPDQIRPDCRTPFPGCHLPCCRSQP
ncbi:hypothetical protein GCM10029992_59360 [Glycomyces albus]